MRRFGNTTLAIVHGQPSWSLESSHVQAWLTRLGGHLGPVCFRLGAATVQPFAIAPWMGEALAPDTPGLLQSLRGDFFCCPFGGNGTPWRGERHPPHGETANVRWRLESVTRKNARVTLHASLETTVRKGRVDKFVRLVDGHTAVYSRHVITGTTGRISVGHHAMLKLSAKTGGGIVSTSRFVRGQVLPGEFESPENRGYQSLRPGALFRSLQRVPRRDGGYADLSHYPARRGYDDLAMLTADARLPFAWTAVTYPGERYVWFALRDPRVLRHTVVWMSNGGRHYPPWNGRHTEVLGLEDATGYFHYGLAESSRPNPLSRRGIPTAIRLQAEHPATVSTIMGMAGIPRGFDRVARITANATGIDLVARSGHRLPVTLDLGWLAAAAPAEP